MLKGKIWLWLKKNDFSGNVSWAEVCFQLMIQKQKINKGNNPLQNNSCWNAALQIKFRNSILEVFCEKMNMIKNIDHQEKQNFLDPW